MAKRKKKKKDGVFPTFRNLSQGISMGLQDETKHTVLAIVFFVLGTLFLLSSLHIAGVAGEFLYRNLEHLLGVGYFLLPTLCLLLGVALLRSVRPEFALPSTLGAFVFVFSGLGLLSSLFKADTGGVFGKYLSMPFLTYFDTILSVIFLSGLLLISLLLIFDTRPRLEHLFFWRMFQKDDQADPLEEEDLSDDLYEDEKEEEMSEMREIIGKETSSERLSREGEEKETDATEGFVERAKKAISGKKKDDEEGYEEALHTFSARDLDEGYIPPPLSYLTKDKGKPGMGDIKANTNTIKRTLRNFGIVVEMDEVSVGPTVTRYALKPAEGVKLSRIVNLQNELALALAAQTVRIEAPIPKTSLVGIEIPNTTKSTLGLGSLLGSKEFENSPVPLLASIGKGVSGIPYFANIGKMPHLLIAGTTGAGKSVTVHSLVTSLLYRNAPSNLRFIMVDPKRVELTLYNGIPHLLSPVITHPKKAILALKWLTKEMERRYDLLEECAVRDISSYHTNVLPALLKEKEENEARGKKQGARQEYSEDEVEDEEENGEEEDAVERMPYIVLLIDELADIMQTYPKELESGIVRLAQMSRAVGIHLVLSTQRPSVNVITGLIKANIPARLALQVASQIDSRTILDMAGAEKLLGAGDMLFLSGEMARPVRLQGAFVSENEVKRVVKYLKKQSDLNEPDSIDFTEDNSQKADVLFGATIDDETEDDSLYEEARETVISAGKASTSYLQRKLGVGYSRAARLMDLLEERGVIGPANGSKPREVLDGGEGYGREDA